MITILPPSPIKLKAFTLEDMDLISSLLQDAILYKRAFHRNLSEKKAHAFLNRFCWEHAVHVDAAPDREGAPTYFRTHTGIYLHHVNSVQGNKAFDEVPSEDLLNLLSVHADEKNEINFIFSQGAHLRFVVEGLCVHFQDLHEAWVTHTKPEHPL